MKTLQITLVALCSVASVAFARPSFWTMTCNDAERLVAAHQYGVTVNYAYSEKAGNLYKKYFPRTNYCQPKKNTRPYSRAIVVTLDNDRCDVGYLCTNGSNEPLR